MQIKAYSPHMKTVVSANVQEERNDIESELTPNNIKKNMGK